MSDGRTAINALRTNDTNIEGTEIDDNIALMNSHFRKYIEAKKEYRKEKKAYIFKKHFSDCYNEIINYISFIISFIITGMIVIITIILL